MARPLVKYLFFFGFIGVAWTVAGLSSIGMQPEIDGWYQGLNRSVLNPPDWVFPAVWSVLYTLEGIAAWLVWSRVGKPSSTRLLKIYFFQLVFVSLWTPIFFKYHLIGLSVIWIFASAVLIWYTVRAFMQADRLAGLLLVPYGLWVTFACYLNLSIYWLMDKI